MSDSGKAVFLSYASQDAEAAKRICEALRAAGVEVWFDTDGGLEHGDEWDAKIRRQIKECVLFIPIISANTQAREEGYFRLEWDLAAERARTIASGVAFILPVVIDDTKEPAALVPDRFRTVQWTKLPGGNVPAEVLQRFLKLWSHRTGLLKHEENAGRAEGRIENHEPETANRAKPRWLAPVLAGGVIALLALVISRPWEKTPPASGPSSLVSTAPAARPSEARELVAKAWVQLNKTELGRSELEAAEELCKQALARDLNDAEAWAASAQVDTWFVYFGLQDTPERREGARAKANRAMQIDPTGYESRLAQAAYLTRAWGNLGVSDGAPEAERMLRELLHERPAEPRTLLTLALLQRNTSRMAEAYATFRQVTENPAFAALAWNELGWAQYIAKEFADAEASADRSIALRPYWGNLSLKLYCGLIVRGDVDQAKRILEQMPPAVLQEDNGATLANYVYYLRREPTAALRVLNNAPRDWLSAGGRSGPRAGFAGIMHEMAGHAAAARTEFLAALKVVDQRLAEKPSSPELLRWKAQLLVHLDRKPEAEGLFRSVWEMQGGANPAFEAYDLVLLERPDEAVAALERAGLVRSNSTAPALLRLDPALDPLRKNPRFLVLLAKLETAERGEATPAGQAAERKSEPAAAEAPDAKSVAVLAFANLSDDKANEYFSDGISEELLNVLAKVPGLKVSARTSAFYFKGKEVPIPEIAKQLGVAYVVEGSVRKQGDKVRITAQLIKAADGFHIWSDTFTRDLRDIFAVQDEIAGLIAQNLRLKIESAPAVASVDPEAFRLLLAGRAKLRQGGNANRDAAIEDIRRAVVVAPNYAAAWAELARAFIEKARTGRMDLDAAFGEARAAARKAATLAPDAPEVLVTLGWVRRTADWDWRGAQEAFRRALALYPDYPDAVSGAAVLFNNLGYVEESLRLGQRATELDPLNVEAHYNLSFFLSNIDRNAEAAAALRRALALAPEADGYHRFLANVLADQGLLEDAERELALEPEAAARLHGQAVILVRRDRKAEALTIIRKMETEINFDLDRAEIYALAGEYDLAFMALERGYNQHGTGMVWLKVDSYLRNLHHDPRWPVLLHKMGLADDQLK